MFGDLQKVVDSLEPAGARDSRGEVVELDRLDRIDLDLPLLHPVSLAGSYARVMPHTDGGGDLAGADGRAKEFGEEHARSLDGKFTASDHHPQTE